MVGVLIAILVPLLTYINKRRFSAKQVEELKSEVEKIKDAFAEIKHENAHMKAAIERIEKRYDSFVDKIWQHFKK